MFQDELSYQRHMLSLWQQSAREKIHVKGVAIEYLLLPPAKVLVSDGRKMVRVPAFSLVHNPTNTGMVFVATTEPEWRRRYTIFHEWHETRSQIGGPERAQKTLRDMYRAIERLGKFHPTLAERFRTSLERRGNAVHTAALAAELCLAKSEMSPEKFSKFVAEAYRDNRF